MENPKCHMCPETIKLWQIDEIPDGGGIVSSDTHYSCQVHMATLFAKLSTKGCTKFFINFIGGTK